ncbi:DUF418 domain-containing protein [Natrialba swarupiae]|nr:DUF418 domain-containing protein [Natrialba swarupiae]
MTGEKSPVSVSDSDSPGPTDPGDRIVSLDALRGFALLGILVINVWLFAMPSAVDKNPVVFGDLTGANYAAWFVSHVFFEVKFMTLFTVLFGAGIVLFTESKERKEQPALKLHYRRTILLLLIGLGHAYLLWYGDILVAYALCALLAVLARNWLPRTLAAVGLALLVVPSLLYVWLGTFAHEIPAEFLTAWQPTDEMIRAEIDAYRGGWIDQMEYRVPTALSFQTVGFAFYTFWRVTGVMLLGMALFKMGILSNERSKRFYRWLLVGGAVFGLALILVGVWYRGYHDWAFVESVFFARQFNYWGSLLLAGAYIAGIMLWCRHRADGVVTGALAAVGRTAFSNYLLQTVLATFIFYGHGLGLFGTLSRIELLGVVVLIWMIQVPLSVLWLRHFRFGPIEWIWRTLTYGERQPLFDRE